MSEGLIDVVSPVTAALTHRIEEGIERLLRLASLQSDALNQEVQVAAEQKRLQEESYVVPKRREEPATSCPKEIVKKPISITLRSGSSSNSEESRSTNMVTWYFGVPAKQAAECGITVKKGKVVFTKRSPQKLYLPVDVPHPEDLRDPLASSSSISETDLQKKQKPPRIINSNASLPISSLPFSLTPKTDSRKSPNGCLQFSLPSSAQKEVATFLGSYDFPLHVVENGSSRVCMGKAVVHRKKGSSWRLLHLEVDDTDGRKLLNLQMELRGREMRDVIINDSYK